MAAPKAKAATGKMTLIMLSLKGSSTNILSDLSSGLPSSQLWDILARSPDWWAFRRR